MLKKIAILLLVFPMLIANARANEITPTIDISQFNGKVVYLDFWASWCVPCRKSFPWMNKIRQQYNDDQLVIIAVNLDKKRELADSFLKEYPATFDIYYDPKSLLAKKYQIKGMPSSIVFDKTGKPAFAHTGFFLDEVELYEAEISKLISAPK